MKKLEDRPSYSQKLVRLRGKKTQKTVAEALGISQTAYALYELGDKRPRDDVKQRIANYYGKTVQYIFFT